MYHAIVKQEVSSGVPAQQTLSNNKHCAPSNANRIPLQKDVSSSVQNTLSYPNVNLIYMRYTLLSQTRHWRLRHAY
jgi:hypothetical protein